jgi:hypothetical protein
MSSLSKEDKDLILEFYFRCGDQDKINAGRDLVASNPEAAVLYSRLEDTLTQLDSEKYEPCPDNLVELTIARLKLAASTGQTELNKLLEIEQRKAASDKSPPNDQPPSNVMFPAFGGNLLRMVGVAAMLLFVASVAFPTLSNMRQRAWRNMCAAGLYNVGAGIVSYANDNDGFIPYVASKAGSLWSKVCDQGEENQSNNRNTYLLVKHGYVEPKNLVCPGHSDREVLKLSRSELEQLFDFPSRDNLNYSFRVMYPNSTMRISDKAFMLMSDLTPVFENVCPGSSSGRGDGSLHVQLNGDLLKRHSPNHMNKGQNILSSNGNVRFVRVRVLNGDDIFAIDNVYYYEGREVPCDPADTFFAP